MSVLHSPDSAYAKEMAKWESVPTRHCPEPLRPYQFYPFPAMFYRAERPPMGGQPVFEEMVVEDELQAGNMRSRGWGSGQAEAVQMLEQREHALSVAAAERAYSEKGMSEKARAEAEAYDQSTASHVGEIPETPIRRPGRPRKTELS